MYTQSYTQSYLKSYLSPTSVLGVPNIYLLREIGLKTIRAH